MFFTHVEGVDHCAQLLESRLGVIVALEELFLGLIHGGYLFDLRSFKGREVLCNGMNVRAASKLTYLLV